MNREALSAIAELVGVALVIISVIMQRLIDTCISSVRMDSKSLVDSQEVAIFGDICLAMILTPGYDDAIFCGRGRSPIAWSQTFRTRAARGRIHTKRAVSG